MIGGNLKSEAVQKLAYAEAAVKMEKLDEALLHYQAYLSLMMQMYKAARDGSEEKAQLLRQMEEKMLVAESIKSSITAQEEEERRIAERRQQMELEKIQQEKQTSSGIFSIFGWSSNSTAKAETNSKEPTIGTEEVKSSSFTAAPPAAPAPSASTNRKNGAPPNIPSDLHDYTAVRNNVSAAVRANNEHNRNQRAAAAGTAGMTARQQQTASVNRLHNGVAARGPTGRPAAPAAAAAKNKIPVDAAPKKSNEYETRIMEEMIDSSPGVQWSDIAGLQLAKQTLQEAVIFPNLRPDLFTGLRRPPKGVLLFGPPGTGKTMLAKAVATVSGFCFFSISASSVTSKYMGEGEKLMKALFDLARAKQPSVIFFDEIDALMSARKENEHEASRRLKTEFMTQVDGASTNSGERLLVMAATNIPWEIDEAVLRRMTKRIYIPLPDDESRRALIQHLLAKQGPQSKPMTARQLEKIVKMTSGYSGSDLTALCQEAALGPIRELGPDALLTIKAENVRAVNEQDFSNAVKNIRPSVSNDNIAHFTKWSQQYGVGT